jgi:hypothetical protein
LLELQDVAMMATNPAMSSTSSFFSAAQFKPIRIRSRAAQESTHPMTTRQKTLKISCNAVLNTSELLEAIFQNMTMKDLLGSRRDCRTWNSLIRHSPRLRRALFLDAGRGLQRLENNRMVVDAATGTWALPGEQDCDNGGQHWSEGQPGGQLRVLNILLFCRGKQCRDKSTAISCGGQQYEPVRFLRPPDMVKLAKPEHFGGSIVGEMFVCQPPIVEVHVDIEYQEVVLRPQTQSDRCLSFRSLRRFDVFNPAGVRMGDIARCFIETVGGVSAEFKLSVIFGDRMRKRTLLCMLETVLISHGEKALLAKAAMPVI